MRKKAEPSNTELLHRIAKGDTAAFDQLFLSHYSGLLRFAKSLMPYPSDGAEDSVCAVFGYIWEHRHKLDSGYTSITAYLYTSVKNRILKELNRERIYERKKDPTENLEITASIHSEPDNILQYKELDERIKYKIDQLPERTKLIFLMNRNDNLTYEEIGELLDISINTVKTHMYRALLFLKTAVFTLGN